MPLLIAAVVALGSSAEPTHWYGPATVVTALPVTGNPYDPVENDVQARFTARDGTREMRLAYFVGDGKFAATLVAPKPGTYTVEFVRNGETISKLDAPVTVSEALPHGFIQLKGRRFQWSDGTPYFPIGYNYAWKFSDETVAQAMLKMGRSGCNWVRIWADHWDNKNPFFPGDKDPVLPGQLRQEPLKIWDDIVESADRAGVDIQMVLFHHGPYSTTTDSNWKEHPWNTANGGFLADPTDFFVNAEAKRRTKIWLRYAVARYAHSPAIMAWELFNEVQWVDAAKLHPERIGDVVKWHKEMGDYLRSLDPYHHLVTSSSSETLDPRVFETMDYLQPHTYPANVLAAIGGYRFPKKPGFFGEFGPPGGPSESYAKMVRDGIYGGILGGHAGAGMYWFWDQVDRRNLGPSFAAARRVIDRSGLVDHPDAKPLGVWCETPKATEAVLAAGLGWAKSSTFTLELPKVGVTDLGGWSQYFQSLDGAQKGWAKPFVVRFTAKESGKMLLNVGQVSSKGGNLQAWVNGKQVLDQSFPAPTAGGGSQGAAREPITVDYPSGPVTVRLENHGADWIRLDSITLPSQAPTAAAHGLGDGTWALIRIYGTDTSNVHITGTGLRDGRYDVNVWNATNGMLLRTSVSVVRGAFDAAGIPNDCVIALAHGR